MSKMTINTTMQKLNILNQMKFKYGAWINPALCFLKYCQNDKEAFVELIFSDNDEDSVMINLDFITDDYETGEIKENAGYPPFFDPNKDIVDNATRFIELDSYSLINCIDDLFTDNAIQEIVNIESPVFF
jgi:hypothetical protein